MYVDILLAEIAGCGMMKIPIHSVTSYAFHEEFVVFWRVGVGVVGGIHVIVQLVLYFSLMILKFRI